MIRISVPENFALAKPMYTAWADDKDSGKNAEVTYILKMLQSLMTTTLNNVTISAATANAADDGDDAAELSNTSNSLKLKQQQQQQQQNPEMLKLTSSAYGGGGVAGSGVTTGGAASGILSSSLLLASKGGAAVSALAATRITKTEQNLFAIDARLGHLTLSRHLDYETSQRHTLIVTAMDAGQPRLSSNLTIVVEVQDVNDNPPQFERTEYMVKVLESMPVNSQVNIKLI